MGDQAGLTRFGSRTGEILQTQFRTASHLGKNLTDSKFKDWLPWRGRVAFPAAGAPRPAGPPPGAAQSPPASFRKPRLPFNLPDLRRDLLLALAHFPPEEKKVLHGGALVPERRPIEFAVPEDYQQRPANEWNNFRVPALD